MSEAHNGPRTSWYNGSTGTASEKLEWFKQYILPYINIVKVVPDGYKKGVNGHVPIFYLPDGTAFASVNGGDVNRDWVYWVTNPEKCPVNIIENMWGGGVFQFMYNGKNMGVFPAGYNNLEAFVINDCKNNLHQSCTILIARNNWKIPKDYPFKVRY